MKVKIDLLKEHPLNQEIYGQDDEEQFTILLNKIKESGWIDPISINKEGTILSGHRRYRAAKLLGYSSIDYEKVDVEPERELEILLSSNVYREKTTVQKLKEAEYYHEIESRKALLRQLSGVTLETSRTQGGRTDKLVAEKIGMSPSSYKRGKQALINSEDIADEGLKHLIEETLNTDITAAKNLSEQPIKIMEQVNEIVNGDVSQVGKVLRTLTKLDQKENFYLPPGKYTVIYTEYNNEEEHDKYSKLSIGDLAEANSVLFLWTLPNLLEQAMKLVHSWGFRYKTAFLWNHDVLNDCSDSGEILLIGIMGNPQMIPLSKDTQLNLEKPKIIHEIIEKGYPQVDKITIKLGEGWELW